MNLFVLFLIIFVCFLSYLIIYAQPDEGAKLVNYRRLIKEKHNRGLITDEEYSEEYHKYREKMIDWEIKSGFAAHREKSYFHHAHWKAYYRRHKERKNKK